ncbi:putative thioesterase [Flavobacterium saliperosum S13]|uniref:Acyl-CoA thioester hydrolase n=2 Tax=Flavobacterium saliperosum TaxID=329186 RepID=A0A1G4W4W1_9FLAO|nr:acyl-CoA thioesterase [Flavobacterium saliperosum]ESU21514.1 putative thioesterase [Flavobacterium saliperosum S13]SCX16808.1 acyl-CoA thioester hydrolase [Flavobacterium saliperosum]
MSVFTKEISIRWSDLDPNFHMRHSAYYDFGAQHRIEILEQQGLTMRIMQQQHFGPVLFREECVFRKEIHMGDTITISTKMGKMKDDASRWTIVHELKNQLGQVCAVLSVDGAWIDTKLRKLASPTPEIAKEVMHAFPKTEDFILL